jgi:hypothetical protein
MNRPRSPLLKWTKEEETKFLEDRYGKLTQEEQEEEDRILAKKRAEEDNHFRQCEELAKQMDVARLAETERLEWQWRQRDELKRQKSRVLIGIVVTVFVFFVVWLVSK